MGEKVRLQREHVALWGAAFQLEPRRAAAEAQAAGAAGTARSALGGAAGEELEAERAAWSWRGGCHAMLEDMAAQQEAASIYARDGRAPGP